MEAQEFVRQVSDRNARYRKAREQTISDTEKHLHDQRLAAIEERLTYLENALAEHLARSASGPAHHVVPPRPPPQASRPVPTEDEHGHLVR